MAALETDIDRVGTGGAPAVTDGDTSHEGGPVKAKTDSRSRWMTITFSSLGIILMALGGGSVVIEGLGDVTISNVEDNTSRMTCVVLGALLLGIAVVVHFGLQETEGRVLSLCVLVVAAIFSYFVLNSDPKVLDLTGFTEDNARSVLQQIDIEVREAVERRSDAPKGDVVGQDPEAGERTGDVILYVSGGPPPPTVPGAIVESDLASAVQRLDAAGITYTLKWVAGQPGGTVLASSSAAGVSADSVVLTVADGGSVPTVPTLVGHTERDALLEAAAVGVAVEVITQEDPADAGIVIDQSPPANTSAAEMQIVVSAGPGAPVVPDVVDLDAEDARAQLSARGISVTISEQPSDTAPKGVVIAQSPAAAARATSVTLVVSSGPSAGAFRGDWVNVDPDTRGLTRVVVEADGSALRAFGSCSPTDCDWGRTTAQLEDDALLAVYEFGYKTTTVSLRVAGPLLLVEVTDDYLESDSRTDRTTIATMDRNDSRSVLEDFEVLRSTDILRDFIDSGAALHVPQLTALAPID